LGVSDFLSVKTWTSKGLVDLSVLFFIHPGTRKVFISGISANPDAAWMRQQARNATMQMEDLGLPAAYFVIDHDTKYTKEFDSIFEAEDATIVRVGPRSPNLNAYSERFAQTLRQECLDHFVVFGERHLRHLLTEFFPTTTSSGRTRDLGRFHAGGTWRIISRPRMRGLRRSSDGANPLSR